MFKRLWKRLILMTKTQTRAIKFYYFIFQQFNSIMISLTLGLSFDSEMKFVLTLAFGLAWTTYPQLNKSTFNNSTKNIDWCFILDNIMFFPLINANIIRTLKNWLRLLKKVLLRHPVWIWLEYLFCLFCGMNLESERNKIV
jgi:hypothetical protein